MNTALKPEQFLTDTAGNPIAVVLDLERYEQLREAEEELADKAASEAAKPAVEAAMKAGDFCTLEEYMEQRQKREG